jgi:hypothetical protein
VPSPWTSPVRGADDLDVDTSGSGDGGGRRPEILRFGRCGLTNQPFGEALMRSVFLSFASPLCKEDHGEKLTGYGVR